MAVIRIEGEEREYPAGTSFMKIAAEYQDRYENDILLVKENGKLKELFKEISRDAELKFITAADKPGQQAYERSVILLFLKALYRVAGREQVEKAVVDFSVTHGYYIEIKGKVRLDEAFVKQIKDCMEEMVRDDQPIIKRTVKTERAVEIFENHGMAEKAHLFRFRRSSQVNIYSMGGFEDYYYGYMVPSSGYLKYFDLQLYGEGLILLLPNRDNPKKTADFIPAPKVFSTLLEASRWGARLEVETVAQLNDAIVAGRANELIQVQEALQEHKLADIATRIRDMEGCKFVMLAGPSSSGKTTTSHRLSVQLKAHGLRPHPIGVDNYFVDRELTPRDENGEYDFEALECIDLENFNRDMTALLAGETVELPVFNFELGRREYRGDRLKLGPDDILVIEGIHALNDAMSYSLPKESKFKIYVSALNQLNIDEHNRIPTTDGRLIRRMVRDARTRGNNARETIARWPSVRRGEDSNIFPYQEDADVVFNSALIYELAVLKTYAEPLLFSVPVDSEEYIEAKRLLKFLDYFLGIGTEMIPKNSILREFIGGSCFKV